MTDREKKIAEIREGLEKATQGKWEYMPSIHSEFAYEVCVDTFFDPIVASVIRKEDANLIANAPEWLGFLLSELERLEREYAEERAAHNAHVTELCEKEKECRKLREEREKLIEGLRMCLFNHGCWREEDYVAYMRDILKEVGVTVE